MGWLILFLITFLPGPLYRKLVGDIAVIIGSFIVAGVSLYVLLNKLHLPNTASVLICIVISILYVAWTVKIRV